MTEAEYKFLEVIYNRGTVQEQSFINFLNGSLPESIENKKEYIDSLISKFRDYGFINNSSAGVFEITDLGREKFEELTERKEINRKLEHLSSRKSRVILFSGKFWLALIIVSIIVSIVTSIVLNHWHNISDMFHKFMK